MRQILREKSNSDASFISPEYVLRMAESSADPSEKSPTRISPKGAALRAAWSERMVKRIWVGLAVVVLITVILMMVAHPNTEAQAKSAGRKTPDQVSTQYVSRTGWLLVCDVQRHTLTVFKNIAKPGKRWKPVRFASYSCTIGALVRKGGRKQTCTPLGYTQIMWKQKVHTFSTSKSWYNCWTKKGFAIHSTMYHKNDQTPRREVDGRLGMNLSNSCIRIRLEQARWIYKTMTKYTPLIVY